jgi:hypothetical protein
MAEKKICITLIALVLVLPVSICWFTADSLPMQGPIVLQLDSSRVVRDGATQIEHYIDDARILPVHNHFELSRVLSKAVGQIFYIGHGSEEGLVVSREIVSWTSIQNLVDNSRAKEHYFAACFFQFNQKPDGKVVMGFDGIIDVDVATILVAAVSYCIHNQFGKLDALAANFVANRGFEKLLNPENPLISVTATILPGRTPYGVWNPLALQITITEAEINAYNHDWLAIAFELFTAIAGPLGIALALFSLGVAWTLSAIWTHDRQGTYPNRYIRLWIPIDPFNILKIYQVILWYLATPNYWWAVVVTYGFIYGPR